MLSNFDSSFIVRFCNKFTARHLLYFEAQLKHVTILPCKTSCVDVFRLSASYWQRHKSCVNTGKVTGKNGSAQSTKYFLIQGQSLLKTYHLTMLCGVCGKMILSMFTLMSHWHSLLFLWCIIPLAFNMEWNLQQRKLIHSSDDLEHRSNEQ